MKTHSSREETQKVVSFVLIGLLVSLVVVFIAMIAINKPTIQELNIIIPVLLVPIVGLVATIVNFYFAKNKVLAARKQGNSKSDT